MAVTKAVPWEWLNSHFDLLKRATDMLQYPERFYYISQILIAFAAGHFAMDINIKKSFRMVLLIVIFATCLSHYAYKAYKGNEDMAGEDLIKDHIIGDYNSWENYDYLLKGTNPDWFKISVGNVSDEEKVISYEYVKRMGHIVYSYSTDYEGEYAEFPLIYYDGYKAFDDLGNELLVTKGDRNRVRVFLPKSTEVRTIDLKYYVGISYYLCDLISIFTVIGLVISLYIRNNKMYSIEKTGCSEL